MHLDVSIVIVSYNTRDLLHDCLGSIAESRPVVSWEAIVVDNASTDGSPDMVKTEFPDVTLLQNSENRGFAAACNQGIARSSGRYVLLLNSDTRVLPGCLDNLVAFADSHPDAGVVGCAQLDGDGRPATSFAYGFVAPVVATSRKVKLLRNGWVSGAAMLIRRTAGESEGWLDERFFFGSEDVEICWRMIKAGWNVYYTPDAQIVHYGAGSSGREFDPRLYEQIRRGSWLRLKLHGSPLQRAGWLFLAALQDASLAVRAITRRQFDRLPVIGRVLAMSWTGRFIA